MTNLPSNISDWTFDTIKAIVIKHEYEPGFFDYKLALNATHPDQKKRDEHLASLRRTVCSMANSGGGFIIFGIRDRNQNVAKPEDRIVGIPVGGDLLHDFGSKIADLQPPVDFEGIPRLIALPEDQSKGLFVVKIPESQRRPHMIRSIGAFYRRGDGGSADLMDFYQVRDLMLMRRQAHFENLKWEIQENIAAICRKAGDLPSPAHNWLSRLRNSTNLTNSDELLLSERETLQVVMFWTLSPRPTRLRTAALLEAIHSGEFLVFEQDTARLAGGQVYRVMQSLNTALDEYRVAHENISRRDEEITKLILAVQQKRKSTPIQTIDLMMLYILHDRQQDALRLAVSLLQHILNPSIQIQMPDLNPASPLEEDAEKLLQERTTPEDVERWVTNGYFAFLLTGENKPTLKDMQEAIDTSSTMQQGLVKPTAEIISRHADEFRRVLESEGTDGAVKWMQTKLTQQTDE